MKFDYYNANPLNRREEDCVTRAISLALKINYYKIQQKLYLIAELFECEKLCVCCYKHLLDDVYKIPRVYNCKGMTIEKFLSLYSSGTYLIRTEGHLTCGIDGVLKDTWNCKNKIIDIVWAIN